MGTDPPPLLDTAYPYGLCYLVLLYPSINDAYRGGRHLQAIDPFVVNPDFEAKQIEKASKACTAICLWVRAMHKYNMVAKQVEPKRKLLAEKQVRVNQAQSRDSLSYF